jgi:hypothetical protein
MNTAAQHKLPRPVEVKPLGKYRLWLRYDDGTTGEVDLSDLAGQGVFKAWEDETFFASVRIAPHGALIWGEDIELCPDMLHARLTGKDIADLMPGLNREGANA